MRITSYCLLNDKRLDLNGQVREFEPLPPGKRLAGLYRELGFNYPKFFKMDKLSKLAFTGMELLMKDNGAKYGEDDIAMLFYNADSSLDTDIRHLETLQKGHSPSPAIFVYTLPNIAMGEIAIRRKWYGENLFILATDFDLAGWLADAALLLENGKARAVAGGWVNAMGNDYDLRFFFAEEKSGMRSYDPEKLKEKWT